MEEQKKELAVMEAPKLSQVEAFFDAERLNQMHKMATYFHQAQCFGVDVKNPQQALVKIQAGLEMGMAPMEAMNSLYIVNGKLTIYGAAMTKRLRLKGWRIAYDEKPDECKVTITKGDETFSYTATSQELRDLKSKAATFALKDKLRWHAVSRLIRFYVPEILEAGIGFYEEEVDNELPGIKVLDVSQAPIMGVEEILTAISAAQSLEDLQTLAGKVDKLTPEDTRKVQEALIKKRAEWAPKKEEKVEEGEIVPPKKEPTMKIEKPIEVDGQDDIVRDLAEKQAMELSKKIDEQTKEDVQKTPAKTQAIDYWTHEKIQSVVAGLTTPAEVHGLKDEFVRLFNDGEVTKSIFDFAVKNIQVRLNQITKKKRDEAEQTSIV